MAEPTIQLGGGNWAGKSDNILGYYKEGERFYKQDFTFSRSTTGTYTDKDGYIQEMPYNEVTYSEQFDLWAISGSITRTSNIATSPNGTLTADGIQDTSGGSYKRVRKSISVNPNSTYTSSCYIKKVTSETAYTGFGLVFSGGTQKLAYGIIDSVNGTITSASSTITPTFNVVSVGDYWRFEMTATDNGSNSSLEFSIYATLSTNGTSLNVGIGSIRTLWGAQINKGTSAKTYFPTTTRLNMPRVDYLNNSNGSLILEPQRSNLITYSSDFTQWGNARTTDTANQITSPDGLNNGTLLEQQSGQTNAGSIYFSVSLSSGTYAQSIFAKKKDKDFIVCYSANAERTYFNLSNGTIGTIASGNTAKIEDYGNGWYRCTITYTITSGSVVAFYLSDSDNSSVVTDSGGVYIYGAQIEAGSYPTTLINTSGSSVTRNADVCNNGGDASRFNSSEGVLYAEFKSFTSTDTVDLNRYITLTNGTSNERVALLLGGNTNQLRAIIYSSSQSINLSFSTTATETKQFNKLAVKYKSGDYAFYLNGVEIGSSTESSIFSANTLDDLSLDVGGGTQQFRGFLKDLRVYNTALTDSELATLTT